ncbi:hypothetical protein AVEN_178827-1 [Araneus ventricosus]|uniref:Uncharacterized protein n=1 Tax=Araneus ventricosus TaxID=182803 RepID=A0A4Y2BDU8_ARAVE|nr:hypothetical protein AVEN_178827-1 [Araneus ventricosus]
MTVVYSRKTGQTMFNKINNERASKQVLIAQLTLMLNPDWGYSTNCVRFMREAVIEQTSRPTVVQSPIPNWSPGVWRRGTRRRSPLAPPSSLLTN